MTSIDGNWGIQEDQRWNGMVGMLIGNQSDICISSLSVTYDRGNVIDYGIPLVRNFMTLIQKKEAQNQINLWVFVEVFNQTVWIMVLVMILSYAGLFALVPMLHIESLHNTSDKFTFLNGVALAGLILLQRDYEMMKTRLPTRILFLFTCATGFVLFSFYTAVLTTNMTVLLAPHRIKSFQDVLGTDYKVVTTQNSAMHSALRDTDPGTSLNKLYESKMRGNPSAFTTQKSTEEHKAMLRADSKLLIFEPGLEFKESGNGYPTLGVKAKSMSAPRFAILFIMGIQVASFCSIVTVFEGIQASWRSLPIVIVLDQPDWEARLNFQYRLDPSIDGNWGINDENGTWNGMVGMLVRNESDVCLSYLSVSLERSQVIDFSVTVVMDYMTLIQKIENQQQIQFW
eukprot:maker-scaffold310_size212938-snap-gene-1.21 protein:Tk03977 transcript:maker-scaffold310_size212938-snap-gene-1.21-mRNA-1 annotation:"hypothetical protein BRAFLDRAFT_85341"